MSNTFYLVCGKEALLIGRDNCCDRKFRITRRYKDISVLEKFLFEHANEDLMSMWDDSLPEDYEVLND